MAGRGQPWLHGLTTVLCAPTVALSEPGGQIQPDGAQGVLHADARVLSRAVLEVGGVEPTAVSGGLLGPGRALFIAVPRGVGGGDADPPVRLEREREVTPGRMREQIRLYSAAGSGLSLEVILRVAADLAVIDEIKAGQAGGPVPITLAAGGTGPRLTWGTGTLRAHLAAPGATASAENGAVVLRWTARLPGRGRWQAAWVMTVDDPGAVAVAAGWPAGPEAVASRKTSRGTSRARSRAGAAAGSPEAASLEAASLEAASLDSSPGPGTGGGPWTRVTAQADDPRLPLLLAQSLADAAALRMAAARSPGDVFLAAGAPWFLTLFGRDSIWAARLLLPFGWQLAAGTLRALVAYQGRRLDPVTGEAPGKIPHELRTAGRASRSGRGSLPSLYYGTIDATPLWICLLHDAWRWGMPAGQVRALLPALTAALRCMRDHGDADGDMFLEYIDHSGRGLANQGWKDSGDAIRFADGTIATAPVALCEVQGYAYEAAAHGADLLAAFGEPGAQEWRDWAGQLAAAFRHRFWVTASAGAYPALALDAGKRRVDSLASNIGHLLGTGLLTAEEEGLVAARLASEDMNSGFGLRTMSAASGGYSPLSYHCGSVWSHDTAIAIRGLARTGHRQLAVSLADGLLAAAEGFGWRLPELFSGEARAQVPWPSPYPASCRPQAWAAASAGALVQALLGLEADVPAGRLSVVRAGPPGAAPGRRLRVEGLVAGSHSFSAGIDERGEGFLEAPQLVPSG